MDFTDSIIFLSIALALYRFSSEGVTRKKIMHESLHTLVKSVLGISKTLGTLSTETGKTDEIKENR